MPNKLTAVTVLLGCALLAGCQARTNVSATGNTAAQFSHVFLTVNQIWFNTSATALATDSTWSKFTLTTPQTVDLVNLNNGTLSQFANQLKLAAGSYSQVMLVLADSTDTLESSASTSGATSNDEVSYIDSVDVARTAPLAILNAAQGINISTSLKVAAATTSSGFGTPTSSAPASSSPVVATTSAIIDFDATRDLVPISLSGQPAYALNPHPQTYNVKYSGNIQGAVSLTGVATLSPAGLPDVQVAAEALSSDGTRHVIVKTTRVDSAGNFILYPLSTASGAQSTYDLVIHGPAIDTVIIKSVPVTAGAPGGATASLGTVTLTAATPFLVNLNSSAPAAPTSSVIGFYQTLPLPSEVPYLVEGRALDPLSGVFASDQSISGGSLQYGSYLTGGTISLTTATPSQGAATYAIAAINPAYGTAALGTTVAAPGAAATTALFTVSAPQVPTGSSANSIAGTVNITSAGAYDKAELFLTYNGALVAAAPLDAYLSGAQNTLTLTAVAPGGSSTASYAPGVYNAEVWAWNSSNPTGTLTRSPAATTIDLSAGNATGVALAIP
ncbi:MAG: DUF4382 domain-containing protein [Steroidobacteraceae bacterium]